MAKLYQIVHKPTFNAKVSIPRIGGEPIEVNFTYQVKDRKELAKVFDSWKKEAEAMYEEAKKAEEEGNGFTLEEWAEKEIALQVKQVKDIVVGWGFEDEFNDENIELLVSTAISVTDAITSSYNEAYTKARVGN